MYIDLKGMNIRVMDGVLYVDVFFFNDTATTEIYTLSLHDALPISYFVSSRSACWIRTSFQSTSSSSAINIGRSEEHTSELQSPDHLVCRLLLENTESRCCAARKWRISLPGNSPFTSHAR